MYQYLQNKIIFLSINLDLIDNNYVFICVILIII